ncbi:DUF2029 domain-containing protein [Motilibacter sp. E257]|uniref:DUF2029 domain-containing protein n=2 Tax=Motilibacter deserti TaxID=2714956 RepID=A0ABX0GPW0_9ACTN|nr:glycosyltransferase family 87 protein [Motilibacter deserti]NHC12488.1 DUF2029 domain-containing protein [Motilibacter deserti]
MTAVVHIGVPNNARWHLIAALAVAFAAYLLALGALRHVPRHAAAGVVLGGAVVLQAVALTQPPRSTDDFLRYVWDGRVQAAGIDPYRYAPVDPALASLRDPWLFPEHCRESACTRINHPTEHTIYPPVAQAAFVAVHAASPPGTRAGPLQAAAALCGLLVTLLLLRLLRSAGRDPRWAALWAWCPLTVYETANNAHVDVLGVVLAVGGLALAARRRSGWAGVVLGLAVAVKVLPGLVVPAAVRHRPVRLLLAMLGTLVLVYVPHVLAVGTGVLGFLPGYLSEEGYSGATRWALLRLVLPDAAAPVAGALVLLAVTAYVVLRGDPAQPWDGALLVTGTAFVLAGPPYPWYLLLLVALAALGRRPEWVAVGAAAYPVYLAPALGMDPVLTQRWAYGAAAVVVLVAAAARVRAARTAAAVPPPQPRTSTSAPTAG